MIRSPPCREFELTSLQNLTVTKAINENFIPIKIVDSSKDSGETNERVKKLEAKYHISVFPSVVVAVSGPDLPMVDMRWGAVSPGELLSFFKSSQHIAPYRLGLSAMIQGDDALALKQLSRWQLTANKSDDRNTYAVLFTSALRLIGAPRKGESTTDRTTAIEAERKILHEAKERITNTSWPYPLLDFLDLSEKQIDALAETNTHGEETEAHFFSAVADYAKGDTKSALKEMDWIRTNCPTDEYICAKIARVWRERWTHSKS